MYYRNTLFFLLLCLFTGPLMGQGTSLTDVNPTNTELGEVDYHDLNNAYLTSEEGIYHSSDGGLSWQLATGTAADRPGPISAYAADRVVAVQDDQVLRSTDHGQTWTPLATPPVSATIGINHIQFVDDQHGWLGVQETNSLVGEFDLWRTVDGGQSWQIASASLSGPPDGQYIYPFFRGFSTLLFTDPLNGFLSQPDSSSNLLGSLLRTTDGGQTWNTVIASGEFRGLQILGDSLVFWGIQYRSVDGGQTWNGPVGPSLVDNYVFWSADDYLKSENTNYVLPTRTNSRWSIGDDQGNSAFLFEIPFSGQAWAFNQGQTIVTESTSMELGFNVIIDQYIFRSDNLVNRPDPIEMEQVRIFPQPAPNQLHIALPEGTMGEELSVVDALGRLVWEKEKVSTGEPIDTSSWPAGMYHLRMTVRGQALTKAVVIQR